MTDESDLTPEQDVVRRLLADARHDGPTPPDVVARLGTVLASLVSERADASGDTRAPVADLGARRRRTATMALLAAAAVVVGGVAIGQGLPGMSGGDSEAGSAGSADSTTALDQEPGAPDGSSAEDDAGAAQQAPESLKSVVPAPETGYPTLSTDDVGLDAELLALRDAQAPATAALEAARLLRDCEVRGIGRGSRVAAQVDGFPGVAVFRRTDGATQRVDLYLCGSAAPVRQVTLPAP